MGRVGRLLAGIAFMLLTLPYARIAAAQNPIAQSATANAIAPAPQKLAAAIAPSAAVSVAPAQFNVAPPSSAATDHQVDGITKADGVIKFDGAQKADSVIEAKRSMNDIYLDGAASDPMSWSVYAYKSSHKIEVFYKGHPYKIIPAVFGRSRWAGGKQWEGDRRTPEGTYLIIDKHRSRRFGWFLRINYPNAEDLNHFAELRAEHEIPAGARAGGQVGIHGTDNPVLNTGNIDWTTGCVSVDNGSIRELARLLPIGTLVVIKP